ncbi:hypothetical protein PI125_g25198 [Phytophthora idaei]|nr:hypothetical protein PI125_g25198 [Phytophthora idaei]
MDLIRDYYDGAQARLIADTFGSEMELLQSCHWRLEVDDLHLLLVFLQPCRSTHISSIV